MFLLRLVLKILTEVIKDEKEVNSIWTYKGKMKVLFKQMLLLSSEPKVQENPQRSSQTHNLQTSTQAHVWVFLPIPEDFRQASPFHISQKGKVTHLATELYSFLNSVHSNSSMSHIFTLSHVEVIAKDRSPNSS